MKNNTQNNTQGNKNNSKNNMKSKINCIFFVLILSFMSIQAAYAQGFEGKRWLLTYQPAFSIGSILSKSNTNTQIFYEYINHHAMIEYVKNRRVSYGAELTFLSFNSQDNFQIHSYGPAIFIRYHGYRRAGAIAPIGNYNKLGLQLLFTQTNDFSGNPVDQDANLTPKPVSFLTTWTVGKRVPISKVLLIDYGMDLSFLTLVPTYSLDSNLANRFIINFKLGLAFAAF
jgi:hypothetical protein